MEAKPNPRLSEIVEAKREAQSRIADAVRKEFDEFRNKTGLIPNGVMVTVVGHYTGGKGERVLDDYLVTDVEISVSYP